MLYYWIYDCDVNKSMVEAIEILIIKLLIIRNWTTFSFVVYIKFKLFELSCLKMPTLALVLGRRACASVLLLAAIYGPYKLFYVYIEM